MLFGKCAVDLQIHTDGYLFGYKVKDYAYQNTENQKRNGENDVI